VSAGVVEPADIFDDRELELRSGAPDAIGDQLGLERVDEGLGKRVVKRVADRSDRPEDAVVVEDLRKRPRRVLSPGIGVMDELDVGAGAALRERHAQCVEDEIGAHVAGELPADDPAAVDVNDKAEEHQALVAAQIGEVRDPQLVGSGRGEIAVDEIRPPPSHRVSDRGPPRLAAALGALDAVGAHQPRNTVAADVDACALECLPGPSVAVGVVVRGLDLADL